MLIGLLLRLERQVEMARRIVVLKDMDEVKAGAIGIHEPKDHWWIFENKDMPTIPWGACPWVDDDFQDDPRHAGKFRIEESE
jgi:hypothetical protein